MHGAAAWIRAIAGGGAGWQIGRARALREARWRDAPAQGAPSRRAHGTVSVNESNTCPVHSTIVPSIFPVPRSKIAACRMPPEATRCPQ